VTLDYRAIPPTNPDRPGLRLLLMVLGTILLLLATFYWLFFFTVGDTVTVDSHFTNSPEAIRGFSISSWREEPDPQNSQLRRVREATYDLFLRRLRYVQEERIDANGVSRVETVEHRADVRWPKTLVIMLISMVVPFGLLAAAKRTGQPIRAAH
jgi:hypothetical protein